MSSDAAGHDEAPVSIDALKDVFISAFDLPAGTDATKLEIGVTPEWDSLGHMTLVAEVEDRFGIALETDDLVAMSSFSAAVDILRRYGVAL